MRRAALPFALAALAACATQGRVRITTYVHESFWDDRPTTVAVQVIATPDAAPRGKLQREISFELPPRGFRPVLDTLRADATLELEVRRWEPGRVSGEARLTLRGGLEVWRCTFRDQTVSLDPADAADDVAQLVVSHLP